MVPPGRPVIPRSPQPSQPDTLESFAAIWYRHNSEAGYYWEMQSNHHYGHSCSYLSGTLALPDVNAIRTAASTHIQSDLFNDKSLFMLHHGLSPHAKMTGPYF